ncbi:hypothetical protein ACJMK2_033318 [Sinanodonta woodiana]|uniref:DBB domain-containing protein n=1 Tax=Sinanodonta woodiana TaxID=1069815 RepID=A0ABD3WS57_SINWO
MSKLEKSHRIFVHEEGRDLARQIKDTFENDIIRVQFQVHEVNSANTTDIYESGVSILLLTSQLLDTIKSGNHPKLDTLFPNPKCSIVLCHCIDKDKSQVSKILSNKVKGFLHWTFINFSSHGDFTDLKLNIMSLVEKSEGVEDVPMTPRLRNFNLWPGEECKPNQSISVLFARPIDDDVEVKVRVIQNGRRVTLDTLRLNSMTYGFNVGDMVEGMKTIEIFVNNSTYGTAQMHVVSNMEQLERHLQDVTNASELLRQSMRCETLDDLDRELLDLLSNYSTSDLNSLFSAFNWKEFGETASKSELPTLLHFGAKFGLLHFCRHLLTLPGGLQAMKIKNKNNLLPHEIAKQYDYDDLAKELRKKYDDYEEGYRSFTSPFTHKGTSSPSREHEQDKSARESGDSGVQIRHSRSGRSSASSTENSRSSLQSSSSESDILYCTDAYCASDFPQIYKVYNAA